MTPSALHRPILALAIAALPLAGAQGAIKQIDKSGKWTAHLLTEKNKRICFVHSEPTKKVGQYTRRGDVFVQIKSNGQGHTGFVVGLSEDDDTVYTCEGNCGNRLKLGRRRRREIHHYIDCLQDGQSMDFSRGDPGVSESVTGDRDR